MPPRPTTSTSAPTLTGLASGTLYHARLVIANGIGTTPGDDVAFTTLGRRCAWRRCPPAARRKKSATKICKVPKVVGKKINVARKKVYAAGCKSKVVYKKSKRPKNTCSRQSRKANKKLVYRAVVKLTVSADVEAHRRRSTSRQEAQGGREGLVTSAGRTGLAVPVREVAYGARGRGLPVLAKNRQEAA